MSGTAVDPLLAEVGGILLRCRGDARRGGAAAARRRFSEASGALGALEGAARDVSRRLVLQRLRAAALSDEGEPFAPAFYDVAGEALKRVHAGGFDFEAAIGTVEELETAAGVPLPAPEGE